MLLACVYTAALTCMHRFFGASANIFFFITVAVGQVKTWGKYPTELPVLVEKATRHLHSCNLNPLEHLSCGTYVLMILLICLIYSLADRNS